MVKRKLHVLRGEFTSPKQEYYDISERYWEPAESLQVPVGTRVWVKDEDVLCAMRFITVKTKTSWRRECHIGTLGEYDVDGYETCTKLGMDYGFYIEDI